MKVYFKPEVRVVAVQSDHAGPLEEFLQATCDQDRGWVLGTNGGGDPDTIPEIAGRVCYMSFDRPRPGGNAAYLKHIKEVGHGSVLEHTVFGFVAWGVSRSLSHELVRHRAGWAYSQLSQRYVGEEHLAMVCPPEICRCKAGYDLVCKFRRTLEVQGVIVPHFDSDAMRKEFGGDYDYVWRDYQVYDRWLAAAEKSVKDYEYLCDVMMPKYAPRYKECSKCRGTGLLDISSPGIAEKDDCPVCDAKGRILTGGIEDRTERRKTVRQTARSVLPNCTETKIYCTANARALRHFFEQRTAKPADTEIRRFAHELWTKVVTIAPNLFGDYVAVGQPDGTFVLDTPYRKV